MFDGCFTWRGIRPTATKVIVVGIDDDSLAEIKKPFAFISPEVAEVVKYLTDQKAAAIGLDIIVPESLQAWPGLQAGGIGDGTTLGAAIAEAGKCRSGGVEDWQSLVAADGSVATQILQRSETNRFSICHLDRR